MASPVWQYNSHTQSAPLLTSVFRNSFCPCCACSQALAVSDRYDESDGRRYSKYIKVMCCALCGWWFVSKDTWDSACGLDHTLHILTATGAALRTFSPGPSDAQLTILEGEIRDHLLGKGTSAEWAALEDVTKGVFREFGYQARVTARSKDGGIDVIVDHAEFGDVYAQVKHTRNKVGVRVLRELIGTMAINGTTNSLLVTSSGFTHGLSKEKALAAQKGFFVELVDGNRLLASLNLTYRRDPPTISEVMDVADPNIQLIIEEVKL
ncbi:restriction endonuclease [Phytopseudomonas argentinensis]|uniref:Restriction endonuclease n=1 Tax=Phytopseudomonas argentinensis TaxID=289370 RepID=A0A1I3GMM9_9GAMM|nr:restriction endonuclease [Pseudomonas argentinensis]SFI24541.1 Restriction endonuclease [Pseudomonas argentinensis]